MLQQSKLDALNIEDFEKEEKTEEEEVDVKNDIDTLYDIVLKNKTNPGFK